MPQEPFSSWFSDTTKALHSCALVFIIFAIILFAVVKGLGVLF